MLTPGCQWQLSVVFSISPIAFAESLMMSRISLPGMLVMATFLASASRSYAEDAPAAQKAANGQKATADAAPSPAKAAEQKPESVGVGTIVADFDNDGAIDVFIANAVQGAGGPTAPQVLSP